MQTLKKFLTDFCRRESGISSVEYALLLAFVAAGIILAAGTLSTAVQTEMTDAAACIGADPAAPPAGC